MNLDQANVTVKYFETPAFKKSLQKLLRAGDRSRLAANKFKEAFDGLLKGQILEDYLNRTHHGESRIENAVKYQLNSFIVYWTVQQNGVFIFLYIGTHPDMDKFLITHAGTKFVTEGLEIKRVQVSGDKRTFTKPPDDSVGSILDRLPNRDEEMDTLLISLSRKQSSDIFALQVGCTEHEILKATASLSMIKTGVYARRSYSLKCRRCGKCR